MAKGEIKGAKVRFSSFPPLTVPQGGERLPSHDVTKQKGRAYRGEPRGTTQAERPSLSLESDGAIDPSTGQREAEYVPVLCVGIACSGFASGNTTKHQKTPPNGRKMDGKGEKGSLHFSIPLLLIIFFCCVPLSLPSG